MTIPRLDSCPKCKGHLMLEQDNYGLYQQCLQCGYLHDLQTFPVLDSKKIEYDKELAGSNPMPTKSTRHVSQNPPQLFESSHSTALVNPPDSQPTLDALHRR